MSARDYQSEYRRRIARALARGLTRSQARGHPKSIGQKSQQEPRVGDAKLELAIRRMNEGKPLSTAAALAHVSAERVRRFIQEEGIAKRHGRRWVLDDNRTRRVAVLTNGRQQMAYVPGFDQASLVGQHYRAAREFVETNNYSLIKPFEGRSVRTTAGKRIRLETDPNELHRIATMDNPEFYEIYEIVS